MSVVNKAKRNLFFGFVNKFVILICPFITRTVIQKTLGAEYLGLNSLFKSVIQVLNLTELGMGVAIVYSLYKPITENDTSMVNALLNFYRRAYHIIGLCILAIGLILIPFLPYLVSADLPENISINTIYIITLADTVISYFLYAYLSSLLIAYQRDDINSKTNLLIILGLTITQIIMLEFFKSYFLFVIMMPVFTLLNNLRIAYIVKRMFPQYHCEGNVPSEMIGEIKKRVKGSFISKSCMVARNSFDSICISAFAGLIMTAKYTNYFYIITGVTSILSVVSSAFMGGIGNHIATKTPKENFSELKNLDFAYMLISGWCTVFIICLAQPFMHLWMGDNMMLEMPIVGMMSLYFYLLKIGDMHSMYVQGKGLWWEHRFRSVVEAILNIVLNVILGKWFGIYGIVLATIITIFFINFLWSASITFKYYFGNDKLMEYYAYHLKYITVTVISCVICLLFCKLISIDNYIFLIAYRILICIFIPFIYFNIIYRNNGGMMYLKSIIRRKNN